MMELIPFNNASQYFNSTNICKNQLYDYLINLGNIVL